MAAAFVVGAWGESMRIALLSPLPPDQNGIADYADSFRHALQKAGAQVDTPLSGRLEGERDSLYAHMASIDWGVYDVVHAELGGGRHGEFLALQWLSRQYPEIPLTVTVHDPERLVWKPADWPQWLVRSPLYQVMVLLANPWTLKKEQRLANRLSRVVVLTQTGAQALRQRMKLPAEKVIVVPHGNHAIAEVLLPSLPPEGALRILYFGFIYRGKGIEDLIDAVALLRRRHPEMTQQLALTLAGGTRPMLAFERKGSYLDELRQRLTQEGMASVTWQPDVPVADIPRLIQAHHVLVLPYRESGKLAWLGKLCGTSGVLSWAAACGRSVISSDARAFAEEVSYGNGAIYPQGDVCALADELERLLMNPQMVEERSCCATGLGQARNWAIVAERFMSLYRDLRVAA